MGHPLFAVEKRQAFWSWPITGLCPMSHGEREEGKKRARRQEQRLASFRVVAFEYCDGAQVHRSGLYGCRQHAVHHEATQGPRGDLIFRETDSMPLVRGGHPAALFTGSPFEIPVNILLREALMRLVDGDRGAR
jgi:hypothetical protein